MTLVVHHLNDSRSQRVLWLLEEMGVEYEIKKYMRNAEMRAPATLEQVHPLGKAPALEHDGRVIVESGAVVDYILERFGDGRLAPKAGSDAFYRYRFFMYWVEGSMMPPLLVKLLTTGVRQAPMPFFIKPIAKKIAGAIDGKFTDGEIEKAFSFLNTELEGREWLCGELSGADIMMSFPVQAGATRVDFTSYPNVAAYRERIAARAAFQRSLEKGGAYSYA